MGVGDNMSGIVWVMEWTSVLVIILHVSKTKQNKTKQKTAKQNTGKQKRESRATKDHSTK